MAGRLAASTCFSGRNPKFLKHPLLLYLCPGPRYFLHTWPHLCFLAFDGEHCFGTVVAKMELHRDVMRGYIAMLVVEKKYRYLGIGG